MKAFQSIKGKLILFSLCISLIPIAVITTIYYLNARSTIKKQTLDWLTAVAESRRLHVLSYIEAKKERTVDFSSDGSIRASLETIHRGELLKRDTIVALNRHLLVNKKPLDPHLEGIEVVDTAGRVIASTHEAIIGKGVTEPDVAYMRTVGKNYTETCIGQPHYTPHLEKNSICAAAPVTRDVEPLGVIINHYNLAFLNEVTTNRAGMGETGEVYLVGRDKLMLTESRFLKGAALRQVVDTEPVRRIVEEGKEMTSIYPDYRGVPVVGASMYLPEYGWILLAEISKAEAFAPLKMLYITALILGCISAGAVTSVGIIFALSIARPINKLKAATEKLSAGDLEHKVEITRRDEIGILSMSFNTMTDLIKERNREIRQANDEMKSLIRTFTTLVQTVGHSSSLEEILLVTLRKAIATTGAIGGEVFLLDEELQEMMPLISEGIDKDFFLAAKAIHFKKGVGLPGMVYERKETVYLEDLANCPYLQRKDIAIEKGYVSGFYIPIMVKGKIHGCLGVIGKERLQYSPNIVSILEAMGTIAASFLESVQNWEALETKSRELSRKVETLWVLREIDRSILQNIGNHDELFEGITHLVGRLIPCDRVTIVTVDKERGGFVYCYGWGTKARKKGDFVPFEHTNAIQVVREKKSILRNDIRQAELLPLDRQLLEEGLLSDLRVPIVVEGEVIALFNIGSRHVAGFSAEDVSIAEGVASQLALAFSLGRLIKRLRQSLFDTVKCLVEAIDAKSPWTKGHSERVAELSYEIAEEFVITEEEVERIRMAALLHDVGKIGTYEGLLDKEGAVTPQEWDLIKEHCVKGTQIMRPVERFNELIPMVLYHHERHDGSGYPEGIKGEEIPLGARIIGVADALDAMVSQRPYRKAMSIEGVLGELKKNAGTQFCPKVAEAALKVLQRRKASA